MGKDLKGKELGVGISQRKDGLYSARFTDRRGKRNQKYFKKLQECRRWIADMQFQNEHCSIESNENMTVETWFNYWMSEFKEKKCKPSTIRNYKDRFNFNIKEYLGKMYIKDVKPLHCQNVLNHMEDSYTNSSIRLVRTLMYSFFNDAVDNDLIMRNPVTKRVQCMRGKGSKPKRVLTIAEQRSLLQVSKKSRFYNAYALILQTGLRVGELIGLQWGDIDFVKQVLHVQRTVKYICDQGGSYWEVGPPKTNTGKRMIPLTQEAVNILHRQKTKNNQIKTLPIEYSDYVFLNPKGKPLTNTVLNSELYQLCEKAEIEVISVHTLRHTFATRCIEAGMIPKTLQTILGHAHLDMTMDLYVHSTEEKKIQEIARIEDKINVV